MRKVVISALLGSAVIFLGSCNNKPKDTQESVASETEEVMIEEEPILVEEELIYSIPVVGPSNTEPAHAKTTHKTSTPAKETPAPAPAKVTTNNLQQNLAAVNVTPVKTVDTTYYSFSVEPENTTRTVTTYGKRGEEIMTVVSNPNDPNTIDYISFTETKHSKDDKKNKSRTDSYGIHVGMSAKEVRNLRHDMKHFVRNGKVFLYNEESNILYELDGITSDGKVVRDQDVEQMNVSAIIWKHKGDKVHIATTKAKK